MTIYTIDLKVAATAYIRAESPEAALQIAKEQFPLRVLSFGDDRQQVGEFAEEPLIMTGEPINGDLPDISLSPLMTVHGPWDDIVEEFAE